MRSWKQCVHGLAVVAVAGLVVACADADSDDAGEATTDATQTPTPPPPAAMTDGQIAMIAMTANSADSAHGEHAKTAATNAEVKAFAQRMITDHGGLNKQAADLAAKTGLVPEESDDSRGLKSDADAKMQELMGKTGADFDKAYIDAEVDMHQKVLDALDQKLIPGATNAELKTLLQTARAGVASHLESAKAIQGKLGS